MKPDVFEKKDFVAPLFACLTNIRTYAFRNKAYIPTGYLFKLFSDRFKGIRRIDLTFGSAKVRNKGLLFARLP
jgi:hypothetical protein